MNMKNLALLLCASLVMCFANVDDASARSRKKRPAPRQQSTLDIIAKVNDHWQQTRSPLVRSFWDEAAYHTGNMEAYRLTGNARWLHYSERWARHNKWMGAQGKDPSKWKYRQYGEGHDYALFGDWQICFQTYLDMYAMNPDAYKIARAVEVMDYEVRQPQSDFWWWADALYMVMPVMTRMYKATGEVKYLDKLYDNYKWADELMYDSVAHLYYRDAKYIYPKATTRSGGKDFWARGDGWVLAGLARVLSDMPSDYRHRHFFEQRFKEMAAAVAQCQQPEGYWTRSMLDKEHAEGPETSGTAFFTYGLLWGVNNGLLQRDEYLPTIDKAWKYLTEMALQDDGAVGYVQPIGERAIPGQQLSERNEANFGVGAFLLAACEHLRFEDGSTVAAKNVATALTIGNESDEYRQQVVEVDAAEVFRRLGIQGGRQLVVRDPAGLELPYQLTYDEKLLVEAGVSPHSTLKLTIEKGTPQTPRTVCYGNIYPERKDDYAWENDRGAYRVYGPALQRTGERSYGIDVWSKNTPELVVEQRYWQEDVVMMPTVEKMRRENRQRGDSLYRTISYHHDHGRGMDLYKVGATLGCGAPALMDEGRVVYPYCFKDYEVLDNGPLRTTVLLNYDKTAFRGDSITEHRIISLDKGQNFNRCTVWYTGFDVKKPASLASGVVVHSEDTQSVAQGSDYVAYADPTDNPPVNNCQLFVATIYPKGIDETRLLPLDSPQSGSYGHALGIKKDYKGERFTYYFGSAWSKYDVRSMAEWRERIAWTLRSLRQPLKVELHS
jgi:rhamnogalacturonyl hydrolase YesR